MDFSKLTPSELDDFLFVNGVDSEKSTGEKIQLATKLSDDPNVRYTEPVVDLYLATKLIKSTNTKQYDYSYLQNSTLHRLTKLFKHFELDATEENRHRLIHILSLAGAIKFELSSLENLPSEVLLIILNKLPDAELNMMCTASKIINNICDSDEFWHDRYDLHINIPVIDRYVNESWKTIYIAYATSKVIQFRIDYTTYEFRMFRDVTIVELFQIIESKELYNRVNSKVACSVKYDRPIIFDRTEITDDDIMRFKGSVRSGINLYLERLDINIPIDDIPLHRLPYINNIVSIDARIIHALPSLSRN